MPTLIQILAPTSIHTRRHGTFLLRRIGLLDAGTAASLLKHSLSDGAFAAAVIHHQLVEPRLALAEVEALPPAVLAHIGRVWLREEEDALLDLTLPPLSAFRAAVQALLQEWCQRDAQAIERTRESFAGMASMGVSSAVAQIHEAVNQALVPSHVYQYMATMVERLSQSYVSTAISALQPMLTIQRYLQNFSRQIEQATAAYQIAYANVGSMVQTLSASLDYAVQLNRSSLFSGLQELFAGLEQMHRAMAPFVESDYGFFAPLLPVRVLMRLASLDPRVRHAVTTRALLPLTCSPEFEERLCLLFQQSPMLARRWRIVQRGLQLHRQRDYIGSIRTLMPEVDGIYDDMLIVRRRVREKQKRLFALEAGGKVKPNKHGKPIALHGLVPLVEHYDFTDDAVMGRVARHLRNSFAPDDRNPNLHGRLFSYDRPMLSVQVILLLFVMAREFLPEDVLTLPGRGAVVPPGAP